MKRFALLAPLELEAGAESSIQVVVRPEADGARAFRIASRPTGAKGWTAHATGALRADPPPEPSPTPADLRAAYVEFLLARVGCSRAWLPVDGAA